MQRLVIVLAVGVALAVPAQAQVRPAEGGYYPRDTETYIINYQAFARSPTTAYLLSAAPGFGFGHFYAEHFTRGIIFAVGEVVGLALVLVAPRLDGTASQVLLYSGLTLFGGFKLADMFFAPDSVELHNKKVAKRLKVKALAIRQTGPGGEAALAYGLTVEAPW